MSTDSAMRTVSQLFSSRRPLPFPLGRPTWPSTVPYPPKREKLGTHYDTAWARRYPVRAARAAYTELVTRPVMAAVARPRTEGLERFDRLQGPVIFAAADYFFNSRLRAAYFAFAINALPIERTKVSRSSTEQASALLEDGWNLLIFPEGGRSPDGWGQQHRGGAAWLAARSGRPVVPVHVQGTWRLLPRGSKRPYFGTTKVTFGAPIAPTEPVRSLVGTIEDALAALADEAASDWWSARLRAARGETPPLRGPEASGWRRAWALGPSPKDRARRRAERSERWPRGS